MILGREYLLTKVTGEIQKVVVQSVIRDSDNNVTSYTVESLGISGHKVIHVNEIKQVLACTTKTDFFTMYTNWWNFAKPGKYQDLNFANRIKNKIISHLEKHSISKMGAEKFEHPDYVLLNKLKYHSNFIANNSYGHN